MVCVTLSIVWAMFPLLEIWSRYRMEGLEISMGVETIENSVEYKPYFLFGLCIFALAPLFSIIASNLASYISV